MNDSSKLSWYGFLMPIGCETQRKNRVKNIVNGYPICNNDFATFEKLEASSIASYQKTFIQLINGM
ncbi:hypothetical protein BYT27DRAFT_7201573 [Phlegmacium glaucopus]|nr:hypothetical protein BYT27DRAFT_7201573 [Phlegmacium glaucopus]